MSKERLKFSPHNETKLISIWSDQLARKKYHDFFISRCRFTVVLTVANRQTSSVANISNFLGASKNCQIFETYLSRRCGRCQMDLFKCTSALVITGTNIIRGGNPLINLERRSVIRYGRWCHRKGSACSILNTPPPLKGAHLQDDVAVFALPLRSHLRMDVPDPYHLPRNETASH